jgi:hypothetical protein
MVEPAPFTYGAAEVAPTKNSSKVRTIASDVKPRLAKTYPKRELQDRSKGAKPEGN